MKDIDYAPITDVFCSVCGTHSTALRPVRESERYDYDTGEYTLIDLVECGGCGEPVRVTRTLKATSQSSENINEKG